MFHPIRIHPGGLVSRRLVVLLVFTILGSATSAQVWRNESNLGAEADYAALNNPTSFITENGLDLSPSITGRIYESGLTDGAIGSGHANIIAEIGWGADGTDPRVTAWTWSSAGFNAHIGNDDEYIATFTTPATAGTYDFTFRFSVDSGASWTLADINGAGANGGLDFNLASLGSFTVNNTTAIPEPGTYAALAGLLGLGFAAWRRKRLAQV